MHQQEEFLKQSLLASIQKLMKNKRKILLRQTLKTLIYEPTDYQKEKLKKTPKVFVPHLLLSICVLVHGAQRVLYPGQPSREAQQQADHPLQVSYEQVVPLQLHGQT